MIDSVRLEVTGNSNINRLTEMPFPSASVGLDEHGVCLFDQVIAEYGAVGVRW